MDTRIDPQRLQSLRRARGWSQEELARAAGVSARTIQRVEAGADGSLETSRALAAAFDVSIADLGPTPREVLNGQRGLRFGFAGVSVGGACGSLGALVSFVTGQSGGFATGLTIGGIGVLCGLCYLALDWHSAQLAARERSRGA